MTTRNSKQKNKLTNILSKSVIIGAMATASLFLNQNNLQSQETGSPNTNLEEIVSEPLDESTGYENPTPINLFNYNFNESNELNINLGYIIGVRIGIGSTSPQINLYGSIGLQNQIRNTTKNISIESNNLLAFNIYSGSQLGISERTRPVQFDISLGSYFTLGEGSRSPHNFYILNYNSPSPFRNTFNSSINWGQLLTYNSAINHNGDGPGIQAQGLFGLRFNDVSLSYTNDTPNPPTYTGLTNKILNLQNTDAGWTGSLTINTFGLELGYHSFTGHRENDDHLFYPEDKHPQTPYHRSLNKATNFIELKGVRLEYLTDGWLQNFIHQRLAGVATYDYEYLGKLKLSFGKEF